MLQINLNEVARGEVLVREEIPKDDPLWEGAEFELSAPLRVELSVTSVGDGILARGRLATTLQLPCRRCLSTAAWPLDEAVDLFFQELSEEDEDAAGDVYPIPPRTAEIDLKEPIREEIILRVPRFAICREACRGLCPKCGADRNDASCDCAEEEKDSPWDALKKIKFD